MRAGDNKARADAQQISSARCLSIVEEKKNSRDQDSRGRLRRKNAGEADKRGKVVCGSDMLRGRMWVGICDAIGAD
jgi:hypothetical protein